MYVYTCSTSLTLIKAYGLKTSVIYGQTSTLAEQIGIARLKGRISKQTALVA